MKKSTINKHKEIIIRAEKEIGTAEIYGHRHNKKIIKYHQYTSLRASRDEVAWCSSFVNFIVHECGLKGTNSAAARSWLKWGKAIDDPIPGCVVVFWRGKPRGWQGHVALFVRETKNAVYVLGGNQNNKVCVKKYPKSRLLGYRVKG